MLNDNKIKEIVSEAILNEYINPKVSQKLTSIIGELTDLHAFMLNSEHYSRHDIQTVTIEKVIDTLKRANRQIGGKPRF